MGSLELICQGKVFSEIDELRDVSLDKDWDRSANSPMHSERLHGDRESRRSIDAKGPKGSWNKAGQHLCCRYPPGAYGAFATAFQ